MGDREISFEGCRPLESHAHQVMVWRNDPATLAASFHQEAKVWESFWPEFRDQYFRHPDYPAPAFALNNGQRIGFVRFEPAPHPNNLVGRTAEVSINIAPEMRGKGWGTAVLRASLSYVVGQGVDTVFAEVREQNRASQEAFRTAGFRDLGVSNKLVEDTGEQCAVVRFVSELTDVFWRSRRSFIVAEAGSNWRMGTPKRDLAMARALIDVAADAGADAVKFQTYRPETVYVKNAGASDYLAAAGIKEDIGAIFADLAMPYEMLGELAAYCRERNVDFMSTGFSPADFQAIDPFVRVHKIASYEISHLNLLTLAARSGKPLILSTGASEEDDIAWAVDTFLAAGGRDLCLLQCTARYPAPIGSLNLRAIEWLRRRFGVAAGLSDHSAEPTVAAVAAVAIGARVIEKHYTLDKRLPGPDHAFAVTPTELTALVREVRMAEQALGDGIKRVLEEEKELARFARRGLQATRDIQRGDVLREGQNFDILRPGQQSLGVHPRHIGRFEGHKAAHSIAAGAGLKPDDAIG